MHVLWHTEFHPRKPKNRNYKTAFSCFVLFTGRCVCLKSCCVLYVAPSACSQSVGWVGLQFGLIPELLGGTHITLWWLGRVTGWGQTAGASPSEHKACLSLFLNATEKSSALCKFRQASHAVPCLRMSIIFSPLQLRPISCDPQRMKMKSD
jgi:hypothetical protein